MLSDLAIRKPAFLRSMRAKVLDRDSTRLPALLVGSRVSWLGVHVQRGGDPDRQDADPADRVRATDGPQGFRTGDRHPDAFRQCLVHSQGRQGHPMAENIKENASALTRFKRAERQRTGAKSIKRGQEIPIAVLVSRVTLKRRFDFDGTVRRAMPKLAQSINRYLNC